MTALTKEPPKTPAQVRKWREGSSYRCILSTSPGYKKDEIYKCSKDADGRLILTARDGLTDLCSMLVSGFVEVDKDTPSLTVV